MQFKDDCFTLLLLALLIVVPASAQDYAWEPWVETQSAQDVESSGLDAQMEPSGGLYCWFMPGGSCFGSTNRIDGVYNNPDCHQTNVNGYRQFNCVDDTFHCTLFETSSGSLVRNCCPKDNMGGNEVCWRSFDVDECSDVYTPGGMFSHFSCG